MTALQNACIATINIFVGLMADRLGTYQWAMLLLVGLDLIAFTLGILLAVYDSRLGKTLNTIAKQKVPETIEKPYVVWSVM